MLDPPTWMQRVAPLLCLLTGVGVCARVEAESNTKASEARARGTSAPQKVDARPAGPVQHAYDALLDQALDEYHLEHFAEARALFTRAHALQPNARTLRGLAMTAYEMRDYAECMAFLQAALRSRVRPLQGALRRSSQRLLDRARTFVGTVAVRVFPTHAQISIDDRPVPPSRRPALVLNLGSHHLEARAPGYQPRSRRIDIRGGETRELDLTLEALSSEASATPPSPYRRVSPAGDEPTDWYESPWVWTGIGVALATALAATLVLGGGNEPSNSGGSTGTVIQGF